MLKSDLIQRIASQNPHLYQRDIETRYSTKSSKLCVAVIELSCGVSEHFQSSSEKHGRGAILVLVLSSRSRRRLCPTSRQERKCARGSIAKPHRAGRQLSCPPSDRPTDRPRSGDVTKLPD